RTMLRRNKERVAHGRTKFPPTVGTFPKPDAVRLDVTVDWQARHSMSEKEKFHLRLIQSTKKSLSSASRTDRFFSSWLVARLDHESSPHEVPHPILSATRLRAKEFEL